MTCFTPSGKYWYVNLDRIWGGVGSMAILLAPNKIIVGGGCSLLPPPCSYAYDSEFWNDDTRQNSCDYLLTWNGQHKFEPVHEISNNVVCATSKASDQPVQTRSLIRAIASRWMFNDCWATDWTLSEASKLKRKLHWLVWVYTCPNTTLLEITCHGSIIIISFWEINTGEANKTTLPPQPQV